MFLHLSEKGSFKDGMLDGSNLCIYFLEMVLIAFICHAGWLPISAGVIKGVRCTSYPTIKDDLINAGAKWEDAACVEDRHFISSRSPDDLPKFCPAIIRHLSQVIPKRRKNF